ncbi:hypothetical protein RRG08_059363 [Elysia crispata]|uniref:Uncharacterized protein n=1 Tax=Elysia crispata TaxID=231223 RepID=A0AAE1BE15_9GAST|nr:hypothetical protein RRG08_059363 [Elysia crispata]
MYLSGAPPHLYNGRPRSGFGPGESFEWLGQIEGQLPGSDTSRSLSSASVGTLLYPVMLSFPSSDSIHITVLLHSLHRPLLALFKPVFLSGRQTVSSGQFRSSAQHPSFPIHS